MPFFSISGSEFVEMFVGVGAARVRDLFEQARTKAPAIIFIDELDALGRARGSARSAVTTRRSRRSTSCSLRWTVRFARRPRHPCGDESPRNAGPRAAPCGSLRPPGARRCPDKRGRVAILQVHLRNTRLAPCVEPEKIAALTPGFTGADLANLVNEATLLATRRGADAVTLEDFTNAVERMVAGLEKRNRLLNPKEREIVAYHEMGHALVAVSIPGTDPVHKVSIIPRGVGVLGYTIQRPTEDRFLMTREELENKMSVLLGGRAAELTVFGHR